MLSHPADPDEVTEVPGDELPPVGDDPEPRAGESCARPLDDRLDVGLGQAPDDIGIERHEGAPLVTFQMMAGVGLGNGRLFPGLEPPVAGQHGAGRAGRSVPRRRVVELAGGDAEPTDESPPGDLGARGPVADEADDRAARVGGEPDPGPSSPRSFLSLICFPLTFAMRRPVTTLVLVIALLSGGVVGLSKRGVAGSPPPGMPKTFPSLDSIGTSARQIKGYIVRQLGSYFHKQEERPHHEQHKIVVTSPEPKDIVLTQQYVCQIRSQRHINVCALENGFLEAILVKEGQAVKKGDLMFKIVPVLYQAKLDAELAEAQLAQLEFNYSKKLAEDKVVSPNDVLLKAAQLAKAKAKATLAAAEVNFTNVVAPFNGIVDRLHEQLGSLIKEGGVLTTLSDNSVMWVYFNVPERRYLEYMADRDQHKDDERVELVLANHNKFPQTGKIGAIEAKFNNETGNIPFRADFPNPDGLLRHGQTGTVLIHRVLQGATVIPQRATFEILDKRYVYLVDKDGVVHQREIAIQNEIEDIFVIKLGLDVSDRFVLEGVRQVREGEKVAYEFRPPEQVIARLKNRAE
jgi:membrane fusion protein (multidrug efflux system)